MNGLLAVFLALGVAQTPLAAEPAPAQPATDGPEQSAARAAAAAEKAAAAAQSAAESAAKAAEAAERIASQGAAAAAPGEPKAEDKAKAAEEKKEPAWTGSVSAGLISLTGNARSITTTGTASARRQSEKWIFAAKAGGAFGQSRPAESTADPEVVALNALFEARADRRFTERYSGYLLAGATTDHVKSIEAFPFGEGGLSILWLEDREEDFVTLRLQTDLAFRYGEELRFQYYPTVANIEDVSVAAPKFGLNFRYALDKNVIFTEDFEILPTVLGPSRLLANSTTKLSARVVSSLSIGVSLVVKHDSLPAEGKVPTDTALNLGFEAGF